MRGASKASVNLAFPEGAKGLRERKSEIFVTFFGVKKSKSSEVAKLQYSPFFVVLFS